MSCIYVQMCALNLRALIELLPRVADSFSREKKMWYSEISLQYSNIGSKRLHLRS